MVRGQKEVKPAHPVAGPDAYKDHQTLSWVLDITDRKQADPPRRAQVTPLLFLIGVQESGYLPQRRAFARETMSRQIAPEPTPFVGPRSTRVALDAETDSLNRLLRKAPLRHG